MSCLVEDLKIGAVALAYRFLSSKDLPATDREVDEEGRGAPASVLKARWRELFDTEPPAYNRRFLESRLAYRIQELAYGGLSRETLERLQAMAKQYASRDPAERKARPMLRPVAGTRLIREWRGVEHCVTVPGEDFEYQGRPYKSLSSVARQIAGTKWNGWVFFGLKNQQGRK